MRTTVAGAVDPSFAVRTFVDSAGYNLPAALVLPDGRLVLGITPSYFINNLPRSRRYPEIWF